VYKIYYYNFIKNRTIKIYHLNTQTKRAISIYKLIITEAYQKNFPIITDNFLFFIDIFKFVNLFVPTK